MSGYVDGPRSASGCCGSVPGRQKGRRSARASPRRGRSAKEWRAPPVLRVCGTAHEWPRWWRDLHDLAPRLFKASPGAAANT